MPNKFRAPTEIFRKAPGQEFPEAIVSEQRAAEAPSGPYGPPAPGEKAPHEDAGHLLNDIIGDTEAAGDTICEVLDQPFEAVGFKGPHRLVDGVLDLQAGLVRNIISHVTRFKK